MRIGILGGSFDPIHKGHISLALSALRQQHLSVVYLMLSPHSPFKLSVRAISLDHKVAMIRRAIRDHKGLKLGRFELTQKGPSYTVDTLDRLSQRWPQSQLFLIMGSDVWRSFHRWKNPKKIQALARVVVGCRTGHRQAVRSTAGLDKPLVLKGQFPDISSTRIRMQLAKGSKLKRFLDPVVERYIRQKGLYGVDSSQTT